MLFDAERHGPEDVAAALRPEALARLREIMRECVELQAEAAGIMRDEAHRLSETAEEEDRAREAIAALFHLIGVGTLGEVAEAEARPAS